MREGRALFCNCAFFSENRAWGTCKHTQRLEWLLMEAEEQALRDAEEDAIALEAEARMSAECPTHGTVADKYRWVTA